MYLEQTSGVRVTVLPHPHLETPHYEIAYNPDGFAPSSYERTEATRSSEKELGYESSEWHLEEADHGKCSCNCYSFNSCCGSEKANHATQPVAQPSAQKQQAHVHG